MAAQLQPPLSPSPPPQRSRAVPWILGGLVLLLLVVIGVGVGGYALYRWKANTANASPESPGGGPEDTHPADLRTTPAQTGSNSNSSAQTTASTPSSWETTATSLSGGDGTTFTQTCTPGGAMHSVWGSGIYTADSSICTAAVHAGLIVYSNGGPVTIELRPGRPIYGSTERNGVTTAVYGSYGRSFVIKGATNDTEVKEAESVTPILWSTSASILTDEPGKTWKLKCPAGGKESTIWGTDIYTGDSSICTAAVHVGLITLDRGGPVTVELRPGESSYQGTTRNGVTSTQYGAYGRSVVVR